MYRKQEEKVYTGKKYTVLKISEKKYRQNTGIKNEEVENQKYYPGIQCNCAEIKEYVFILANYCLLVQRILSQISPFRMTSVLILKKFRF